MRFLFRTIDRCYRCYRCLSALLSKVSGLPFHRRRLNRIGSIGSIGQKSPVFPIIVPFFRTSPPSTLGSIVEAVFYLSGGAYHRTC